MYWQLIFESKHKKKSMWEIKHGWREQRFFFFTHISDKNFFFSLLIIKQGLIKGSTTTTLTKHLNSGNCVSALLNLFSQFNVSWKPILVQFTLLLLLLLFSLLWLKTYLKRTWVVSCISWQLGCSFICYFSAMLSFVKAYFFFPLYIKQHLPKGSTMAAKPNI